MIKRILLIALAVLLLLAGYVVVTLPNVSNLATEMPKSTAFMDHRRAELKRQGKDDTLMYQPVSYSRISPFSVRAALVAEHKLYEQNAVEAKR